MAIAKEAIEANLRELQDDDLANDWLSIFGYGWADEDDTHEMPYSDSIEHKV